MKNNLKTSIQYLKGVGPKRFKLLEKLGLKTAEGLLYYFPRRYEDRSKFASISQLTSGVAQAILATVLTAGLRRSPKRKIFIFELMAQDKTGKIKCLWFNQPYLHKYFKPGQKVILYGKAEAYNNRLQINSPDYEILEDDEDFNPLAEIPGFQAGDECVQENISASGREPQTLVRGVSTSVKQSLNIGRIVPIYSLTEGLNQRYLRKIIKGCLDEFIPALSDVLPYEIRNRLNLLNLAQSLNQIHFPQDLEKQQLALRRLSFEEFFLYQLPVVLRKRNAAKKQGIAQKINPLFIKEIINGLDFKLTLAQQKVLNEIIKDMASLQPMHRLLQGDVGCGKTIVAFLASLIAINCGYQVAFMVPTEILASQHFENFSRLVKKIKGLQKLKICLLTSGLDKKSQQAYYRRIKQGRINLVIGTHSLIEEGLEFNNLSLVVIDEQHKFGVSQRALLPKKGKNPDCLIMTATPIPRTLSLTLYGDLDISVIDELPLGRQEVKTLRFLESQRKGAYDFVKQELRAGRQAYIVYPLIEESEILDLKAANQMYKELKEKEFSQFKLGLIHGKIKKDQAKAVMQSFENGKIDLLVATSVLEVGVDVANATCMVVEHAERFGLSQLHQLRGRIGRGVFKSFCILIADAKTPEAIARLKAITELNDGFKIAEEDLRIRGPGEFFGKRQHGLSELKIANPLTQMHLLKLAREEAKKIILNDPNLEQRQNSAIKQLLKERFGQFEDLEEAG